MSRAALNEALDLVVDETARKVAALGFRRRGPILRAMGQVNAGLIEFQKSTKNSADHIFFTVNLAVAYGALLDPDQLSLEKVRSPEAQVVSQVVV
jgi:hypothetical protein